MTTMTMMVLFICFLNEIELMQTWVVSSFHLFFPKMIRVDFCGIVIFKSSYMSVLVYLEALFGLLGGGFFPRSFRQG